MVDSLRFGLRRDKTRWLVVPDAPPDDAQMASMGFVLGSSTLETGHLAPEELKELLLLLGEPSARLTLFQRERLGDLLEDCPRKSPLPPLDLDIRDKIAATDRIAAYRSTLLLLSEACADIGLGAPSWYCTGGSGFHGHLCFPAHYPGHPDLVGVVGGLIREMAAKINIPLLSDHREKSSRPDMVLDDTLFCRTPRSRGVIWRLDTAQHPSGGRKFRIDELDTFAPPAMPAPVNINAIHEKLAKVRRSTSKSGTSVSKQSKSASRLDSEISTWQRVAECPVCGHPRCRVSPDGTSAYCFRHATKNTPGELIMLKRVTFKTKIPPATRSEHPEYLEPEVIPEEQLISLKTDVRGTGVAESLKKERSAVKLFERHCTCGMAWFHRVCTHPRHAGEPQTLRKSPLSCGTTHVCRKCARSMQNKVRETRAVLLDKFMGNEIAIIRGWTDRPQDRDDAMAHYNWVFQATELQSEMGAVKRNTSDPGLSYIGAEMWQKHNSLPYRPVTFMVVPRLNAHYILEKLEERVDWAHFDVQFLSPVEASEYIANSCITLTYVPRTQQQKWAQLRALLGRRCIRSYRKMPAIEHWDRGEIAELRIKMGLDKPADECEHDDESCPVCKEETDLLYLENQIKLPNGQSMPWVRGGLKTHKLVKLILKTACRSPG